MNWIGRLVVFSLALLTLSPTTAESETSYAVPRIRGWIGEGLSPGQIGWYWDQSADFGIYYDNADNLGSHPRDTPIDVYLVAVPPSTGFSRLISTSITTRCLAAEAVEINPDFIDDDPSLLGFDLRPVSGCADGTDPIWLARLTVRWGGISSETPFECWTASPPYAYGGLLRILRSSTRSQSFTACDGVGPMPVRYGATNTIWWDPAGSLWIGPSDAVLGWALEPNLFPALPPTAAAPSSRFEVSSTLGTREDPVIGWMLDRRSEPCNRYSSSSKLSGQRLTVRWDPERLNFVKPTIYQPGWRVGLVEAGVDSARIEVFCTDPGDALSPGDRFLGLVFDSTEVLGPTEIEVSDYENRRTCPGVQDEPEPLNLGEWTGAYWPVPRRTMHTIVENPRDYVRVGNRSNSVSLNDVRQIHAIVNDPSRTSSSDLALWDVDGNFTLDPRDLRWAMLMAMEYTSTTAHSPLGDATWSREIEISGASVAEFRLQLPDGCGPLVAVEATDGTYQTHFRGQRILAITSQPEQRPRRLTLHFADPEPGEPLILRGFRGIDESGQPVAPGIVIDPLVAVGVPSNPRSSVRVDVAPNPFNPRSRVTFVAPAGSRAVVAAFDARGRQVAVLFDGEATGTEQSATWHADDLASGVYYVRVDAGVESETTKVVLSK